MENKSEEAFDILEKLDLMDIEKLDYNLIKNNSLEQDLAFCDISNNLLGEKQDIPNEKIEEIVFKNENKVKGFFTFMFKYVFTSSLIF
jgi:hypothetical protein